MSVPITYFDPSWNENKITYIDLGKVTPEIFSSMWEIDQVLNITSSTIFKWQADRPLCHFWQGPFYGGHDWTNGIDWWHYDNTNISAIMTSSLLSDVTMMRCWEAADGMAGPSMKNDPFWEPGIETELRLATMIPKDEDTGSFHLEPYDPAYEGQQWNPEIEHLYTDEGYDVAWYTEDEHLTNYILILPNSNQAMGIPITNKMHTKFREILSEKNIMVSSSGNDSLYKHSRDINTNKWKKCVGSITRPSWNNMVYIDFGITWNFDRTLANRIRAVATGSNILIKKFKAVDAGENIEGLYALTSSYDIDRDTFEADFENRIFNYLQVTKSISSLTTEESQSLWTRGHQRLNDTNWQYYGNNSAYTASLSTKHIGNP